MEKTERIGGLVFKEIDPQARSAVAAELPAGKRKGIYCYVFSNNTFYIGKSKDMVVRHGQHLHEYKDRPDMRGVAIARALFASLPAKTGKQELDDIETDMIRWAERQGWELQNRAKTNRPGDGGDIKVLLDSSAVFRLPWDRAKRSNACVPAKLGRSTQSQVKRHDKLKALPYWSELRALLRRYVAETIQEPAHTAGTLWSASALPGGREGAPPLVCISCGVLESLVVYREGDGVGGFLNCKRPAEDKLPFPKVWGSDKDQYKASKDVIRRYFYSLDELERLLENERLLNWCWRLNIEMMWKSGNPNVRALNPRLVRDLLGKSIYGNV
ncbi:MAG: hypothetical protein Q4E12_06275 [Coriobacteriia bacterium]|nr:hypothetical protein [Coriobacteriia bacterium]